MQGNQPYANFIFAWLQGTITPAEQSELDAWIATSPDNAALWEELTSEASLALAIKEQHPDNQQLITDRIWQKINERRVLEAPVRNLRRRWILQFAAAACIILLLGVGIYQFFFNRSIDKPGDQEIVSGEVTAPTANRAMITLENGKTIYLDSAANGELATQSSVKLVKLANGQIAYQSADGTVATELKYNTLSNPRGSQVIDMQLADGSHVWLNAGSSVTYPIAFIGNDRNVAITGEAYFEVAPDKSKPFIVSKDNTSVEVLGTHFNVNAYDNERVIKVTLLEGSVKVKKENQAATIKPGQQASVTSDIKVSDADTEQVMAWKNGFFILEGLSTAEVMRQLERWYNIEVKYENGVPNLKLKGDLSRDMTLNDLLFVLEKLGVKYKIENRTLTIRK